MSIKQTLRAAVTVAGLSTTGADHKAKAREVILSCADAVVMLDEQVRAAQAALEVAVTDADPQGWFADHADAIITATKEQYPVVDYGYYSISYAVAIAAISRFSPLGGDLHAKLVPGEDLIVSVTESDWADKPEGWSDVALVAPVAINLAGYSYHAKANPAAWQQAKACSLQVKSLIAAGLAESVGEYVPATKSAKTLEAMLATMPVA